MSLFIVTYRKGPQWIEEKRGDQQPHMDEHVVFVRKLYESGSLVLSGPFTDNLGSETGMAIIMARDNKELESILRLDPLVVNGVNFVECHNFRLVFCNSTLLGAKEDSGSN